MLLAASVGAWWPFDTATPTPVPGNPVSREWQKRHKTPTVTPIATVTIVPQSNGSPLHAGAAVRDNTSGNIVGGGLFGAYGGETHTIAWSWYPGLAVNQGIYVDVSAAMTTVEVDVAYVIF